MPIDIIDPQFQTLAFSLLFLAALLVSVRKAERTEAFPVGMTGAVKGFAILAVIFGHIGYFLAKDHAFLFPLSTISGVGVNLFLLLSGFGLTISFEKAEQRPLEFYRHRARHLLAPLWITLTVFYLADLFLLKKAYLPATVIMSYFGIAPGTSMFGDLDSPLWYLTLLIAYYLIFPILYKKRHPYLSAALLLILGKLFALAMQPLVGSTMWLYLVHIVAFPLGVVLAQLLKHVPKRSMTELLPSVVRWPAAILLAGIIGFTAIHSGVGQWSEQPISIVTALAVIGLFMLLPFRFALLDIVGAYSYEIYLLHWPVLSRYDLLYKHLPASLATAAYLAVFLALGWVLQRCSRAFTIRAHEKSRPQV